MGVTGEYYLGLDMGTSSLGWAYTDTEYKLLRAKGKDLWGVRLFDEANTSVERRTNRVNRRRRQRQLARIGVLKEFFADEIEKIDEGFFLRCEESKFKIGDRSENNKQKYALFAGEDFTDKDYYEKYPTIFHLRKELIESTQPHDVRLVYLAILNMFKHRGHFLNSGTINISENSSLKNTILEIISMADDMEIHFNAECVDDEVEQILNDKQISKSQKHIRLIEKLNLSKTKNKRECELLKLMTGLSAKFAVIFPDDIADDELKKKSISFRDSNFEEEIYEMEKELSDEDLELIDKVKEVHDLCLLVSIRKGYTYLSQARVSDYEKHKSDLKLLQSLVREFVPEEYDDFFRKMGKDNYSAYVGSVNSKCEKVRRNPQRGGKAVTTEEFYKSVKKLLEKMPAEDERVKSIYNDIENENFMPKQLTASNGVIPNQLHLAELHIILENASSYLPFLNDVDERGLSVKEKIEQLYKFHIPYYVGPVNPYHSDKGGNAWVVRKEKGRVYPWNFEEKIDTRASREEFIKKMVRHCTYLNDEKVLPKNSLMYEKFMVLNELNNVKIYDEKISVEIKQDIYNKLFLSGKRVTGKKLFDYFVDNGLLSKDERSAISGIDKDFNTSLSSYGKFYGVLGERANQDDMKKIIEDIIFWGTVYSNDKKVVGECIDEKYPDVFTKEEKKRILGFKFKDWGKLSKEFLEMEGADKNTGEIQSIIQRMWNENVNLMQLLSSDYTYIDEIEKKSSSAECTLSEIRYEDICDMNLSAPVRRMVWQTLLVLKDVHKVLNKDPKKIFVEMARGGGKKGERKASRKKKFQELYKKCAEDERKLVEQIEHTDDSEFRSKKLYLYYLQKGRCMYTGERIELSELFNDNKYDIDHIYPRHFVKDDNIENNLVLVKKEKNAHKSDTFPIEESIRKDMWAWWKSLHDEGFMNDEKYKRLTRKEGFTEQDLAGFISRQLVETHQGTRIMTQILKMVFPESDIIFPKGSNVSEFRKKFNLLKVRNVNDFHHAQDAYLNIVVGNSYDVKFTKSPMNFVKEYNRDKRKYAYNMGRMFEKDIERDGKKAWIAPKDENGNTGSIVTVKKMLAKNSPLVTRMNLEAHGGIANQTVYCAEKAKDKVYLPMKTSDSRLSNVEEYGGVTSITTAYYMVVEHGDEKKRIRTIEMVPIYLKSYVEASEENMIEYCEKYLQLKNPRICMSKLKMQSLIKRSGFFLHIGGRTEDRIEVRNAVPLCLRQEWINYIKEINNYIEKGLSESDETKVCREKNIELFNILKEKHTSGIYAKKPNNKITKNIKEWKEKFDDADLDAQVEAISELLKMTECNNNSMNAKKLGFKSSGMKISNNISKTDEFLLINQSPSGLFEDVVDLKKI